MSAARRTSRCNPGRPNPQPWARGPQRHREEAMSHIDPQVDPEVLADIRRAAFELRQTDPQEAVRLLRRAAATGGGAEVLARGALGEIYLEEFGDLDGALHEFRRVLQLAPGLPAAELGLARTLRASGDYGGASDGFERALGGLERDLRAF